MIPREASQLDYRPARPGQMPARYRNRVMWPNRRLQQRWDYLEQEASKIVASVYGVIPLALAEERDAVRAELQRRGITCTPCTPYVCHTDCGCRCHA